MQPTVFVRALARGPLGVAAVLIFAPSPLGIDVRMPGKTRLLARRHGHWARRRNDVSAIGVKSRDGWLTAVGKQHVSRQADLSNCAFAEFAAQRERTAVARNQRA
jgi:hypothetical protein